ncbi:MAG: ankyrin repeat domain-containing protein [Bacteroidetes bacterium]|nr:ankyrin repeat domain-containing protein [Bacteroidota bacterium]
MDYLQRIITAFELHSVKEINLCFDQGVDPNQLVNGRPLIQELITMYTRGPQFKTCIRAFVDRGVFFEDQALLAVLLDDPARLDALLKENKAAILKRYSLPCTFTPLHEATLLHICAEYNHVACADVLIKHGANCNEPAGVDEHGFGGQTPIFHTVNQDANKSIDMLKFLLLQNADLSLTVKGMVWGKGFPWETFVPSVNPISYAMMGLLRQFQRTEKQIYEVVSLLMKARYGVDYHPGNIPNKYLES